MLKTVPMQMGRMFGRIHSMLQRLKNGALREIRTDHIRSIP